MCSARSRRRRTAGRPSPFHMKRRNTMTRMITNASVIRSDIASEDDMGMAVVTIASGGLPVVDVTSVAPKTGLSVTEATNGRGVAVTKVAARGMPVMYVAATLQT